jgi:uncharacterized membrane protein YkoI
MKRTALVAVIGILAATVGARSSAAMEVVRSGRTGAGHAAARSEKPEATADQKLTMSKLPPAVRATVEAESKGATVKGISSEKENGKTVYELETIVNGRTRDLMIDATGRVYVVEEQLDVEAAPPAVRSAIEAKGKILSLESVRKSGITTYEAQVQTKAGKKLAVDVDASGKPVKP